MIDLKSASMTAGERPAKAPRDPALTGGER